MNDYAASWEALKATDPEVAGAIASELGRERSTLRLIASENYASPAVLAAQASTMNNKYAEGYPGRRYYGGCEFVDVTETLAIGARIVAPALAREILNVWLETSFEGGRHVPRLEQIAAIERGEL